VPHGTQVTGVILAGGRGRRMGGRDKGWIELDGRTLIERVLERFAPQVQRVVISANRNLERYGALGVQVVADELPDHPGPLAGLHAAFHATDAELLAAVPCDSPFFPADLVARLRGALLAADAEAAIAICAGRMQPTFCLCARRALVTLDTALASGERRVERWLRGLCLAEVPFQDAEAFRNFNTPDELSGAPG
jgi:molybdopterin-guanine dinucleotide biosynthesis protein A